MSETVCYNCQTLLDPQATKCANCGQPQILRGRYRIKRLLGQGGFGVVYEAYDIDLQRHYAIKLINVMSPAMREQVTVEAQILAQHARRFPFIPEIYDIWTEANYLILVMEYVGGATLGSLIEKHGAFPPKSVGQFLYAMLGHLD
ncbi:MAG: protein kinase, partial [Herpetosiphon sp.]|nr:protein kinase [Herpetosiphon sp.]